METLPSRSQDRKKKAGDSVKTIPPQASVATSKNAQPVATLDVRALACPGPVIRLKKQMEQLEPEQALHVLAPATFAADLNSWAATNGHVVSNVQDKGDWLEADVTKGTPAAPSHSSASPGGHSVAIVLFSNDLDKALAALILANGLAASGAKVGIFFTFWGLSVLRKNPAPPVSKNWISRLFGWMLPTGARKLALSKMHMMGMGTAMMKKVMGDKHVLTLPELLQSARQAGVRFIACDMAMDVMGITREELIEVDEVAGVASFARLAKDANNTLFI